MARGRVAVVTGGGGDIGGAICTRLAADGWSVLVCDRDGAAATSVAERAGASALAWQADVTDAEQVATLMVRAREHGELGAVVHTVGVAGPVRPVAEFPEEDFARVMRLNVHSTFLMLRAALPVLRAAGTGAVVNLGSTSSIRARANLAGYVASKHAVLGLTRVAALESVGTGVRVNAVLPGPVRTRMIDEINEGNRALAPAAPGGGEVRRATTAPYGEADDVAATVRYLVSPDAAHVNGAAWVVDGGSTLA